MKVWLSVWFALLGVWWVTLKPWAERAQVRLAARRARRGALRVSRAEWIRRRMARPASARWLFFEARRLAFAGASWDEVLADLNPRRDGAVLGVLMRLRAVWPERPLPALEVVAGACKAALKANDEATAFDALSLAARCAPPVPVARF
jgi:hypothetical protein